MATGGIHHPIPVTVIEGLKRKFVALIEFQDEFRIAARVYNLHRLPFPDRLSQKMLV